MNPVVVEETEGLNLGSSGTKIPTSRDIYEKKGNFVRNPNMALFLTSV